MPPTTRKRARANPDMSDKENQITTPPKKIAKRSNASRDATDKQDVINPSDEVEEEDVAKPKKKKSTQANSAAREDDKRAKEGKKAYTAMVKTVTKEFTELLKKQKVIANLGRCLITADTYSAYMEKHLPEVDKIMELSPTHAFLTVLFLADHAYGDLESCGKSCGVRDSDGPFQKMDERLLQAIELRLKTDPPQFNVEGDPGKDDLGLDKELEAYRRSLGRYPKNKQERTNVQKWRRHDLRDRNNKMKDRRELAKDWVSNALEDILETHASIDGYGIGDHFFTNSIKRLQEIKAAA